MRISTAPPGARSPTTNRRRGRRRLRSTSDDIDGPRGRAGPEIRSDD